MVVNQAELLRLINHTNNARDAGLFVIMKCEILNSDITVDGLEPVCGQDFCYECGDCLHCYRDDWCPCTENEEHVWIITKDALAMILSGNCGCDIFESPCKK